MNGAHTEFNPELVRDRDDPLTRRVIGAAIEVHRAVGPGLLESAYQACLAYEIKQQGLAIETEVPLPVTYKGVQLEIGYRIDILVAEQLVVELKAVDRLLPVHEAQLLTYLKLSGYKKGLLINFSGPTIKDGLKRMVL